MPKPIKKRTKPKTSRAARGPDDRQQRSAAPPGAAARLRRRAVLGARLLAGPRAATAQRIAPPIDPPGDTPTQVDLDAIEAARAKRERRAARNQRVAVVGHGVAA